MAIVHEDALEIKNELKDEYQARHQDFERLRDFWHGRYWQATERTSNSVTSIYRDLTANRSDTGPDIKLVHNVIMEVCTKFQAFLSPLPMIRAYIDPPESQQRRNQATLKERALYGCWSEGQMAQKLNSAAWYLPLMGNCFLGIWPDFDQNIPRPLLRSPEYAYPVMNYDNSALDAILFCWKVPLSRVKRQYPDFKVPEKKGNRFRLGRQPEEKDSVEILEYSDKNEFARWVEGKKVNGVEHEFGFNLFEQLSFIHVPDEPWDHSAVEQAINLNEAENILRSLLLQAVIENVFPHIVLIDPSKAPEELDMGPGGVWGVNAGGDVKVVGPPVQALPVQQQFLNENERAIKQATSMPDVSFGVAPTSSVATGKAINELQGAGTGSMVEMVQGVGIGSGLVSWNEKALYMFQTMFHDERIYLHGVERGGAFEIQPRRFGVKFNGSQIVGSQRNEVVFSPHLNMHEKLVMGLQAMGASLVSKEYVRNQIGIPDSRAMDEEIASERVEDAVLEGVMGALVNAGAEPDAGQDAEEQILAYLSGSNFAPGAPPAPMAPGGGAGGPQMPIGPIIPGAPGQAFSPALKLPPGSPPPAGMAAPPAQGAGGIPLDEAVAAFQSLQGIQGRVFLIGEIVQTGQATDDIEVAITVPQDRQVLADGLPQYAGMLAFRGVEAEPEEQFIEVTPGAEPVQGGAEPDLGLEGEEEIA